MPWLMLSLEPLPTFAIVLHCDSVVYVHAPAMYRILIYEWMQTFRYRIKSRWGWNGKNKTNKQEKKRRNEKISYIYKLSKLIKIMLHAWVLLHAIQFLMCMRNKKNSRHKGVLWWIAFKDFCQLIVFSHPCQMMNAYWQKFELRSNLW